MNRNVIIRTLLLLFSAMFFTACDQIGDVSIHEPGQYRGQVDTLSADTDLLQQRVMLQQDR